MIISLVVYIYWRLIFIYFWEPSMILGHQIGRIILLGRFQAIVNSRSAEARRKVSVVGRLSFYLSTPVAVR